MKEINGTSTVPAAPVRMDRYHLLSALSASGHQAAGVLRRVMERNNIFDHTVAELHLRLLRLIEERAFVTVPAGSGLIALFRDEEEGWMSSLHLSSVGVEFNRFPVAAGSVAIRSLQPYPAGQGYGNALPEPVRAAILSLLGHQVELSDYAGEGCEVRLAAAPLRGVDTFTQLRNWLMSSAEGSRHQKDVPFWSREPGNECLTFVSGDAVLGLEVRDYLLDTSRRYDLRMVPAWHHHGLHLHWHHFTSRHASRPYFTDF